ncbi:beta-ketoacyl reductase, partial [Streptomyces sp. SID3343]|uniref:beta-ketoacyl reductase n=1 Tax=Streptomyces sp. SID3343 TaxID=2690260 RepID=UPI0013705CC8
DEKQARVLLDPDALEMPPMRGVLHAAGVITGGMLADLTRDALEADLRPKVAGSVTLHRLYPPGSVDFFVLFSAVAAQLGLTGQGAYATANAFLDALAEHRRADGCPGARSLAWPAWRETGLAATAGGLESEFEAVGVRDVTERQAMAAWRHARGCAPAHVVVLPVDRSRPPARPLPLLERLFAQAPPREAADGPAARFLDPSRPGGVCEEEVLAEVARIVAAELGLASAAVDRSRPLAEVGMESIMALAVRRRLEQAFALALPATLLWNHPTVRALGARMVAELAPAAVESAQDEPSRPSPRAAPSVESEAMSTDLGFDALLDELEADTTAGTASRTSADVTEGRG